MAVGLRLPARVPRACPATRRSTTLCRRANRVRRAALTPPPPPPLASPRQQVVECVKVAAAPPAKGKGKKKKKKGGDDAGDAAPAPKDTYHVVLADSVLFPEGGGQPADHGTINGVKVIDVQNIGGKAVHTLEGPVDVGAEADLVVDWRRRWDHMQQHSGQHLVRTHAY